MFLFYLLKDLLCLLDVLKQVALHSVFSSHSRIMPCIIRSVYSFRVFYIRQYFTIFIFNSDPNRLLIAARAFEA